MSPFMTPNFASSGSHTPLAVDMRTIGSSGVAGRSSDRPVS
jgi:hypothetical protein